MHIWRGGATSIARANRQIQISLADALSKFGAQTVPTFSERSVREARLNAATGILAQFSYGSTHGAWR